MNLTPQAMLTPLLTSTNKKTIDTGSNGLTVSLHANGMIHSMNCYHPEHGYITVSPMSQFPNDKWYDSLYVRQYRKELAETSLGFGVLPDLPFENVHPYYLENTFPCFLYQWNNIMFQSTYYPKVYGKKSYLVHKLKIINHHEKEMNVPIKIGGVFSLNRCSFGQLTEGGPIQVPCPENILYVTGHRLTLSNENLPSTFSSFHFHNGHPLKLIDRNQESHSPISYYRNVELSIGKGQSEVITSVYTFSEDDVTYKFATSLVDNILTDNNNLELKDDFLHSSYIIERNVDYILSCCSVPVNEGNCCIITDHQLLPLSWNRDSYYMINLLLEVIDHVNKEKREKIQEVVKGHLCWLFENAQRHEGYWGRAYLTNGFCKDNIFQLDQQIYPLLEICRYYEVFNDSSIINKIIPYLGEIYNVIMSYKDDEKWLFKTGETPADDKVNFPYHFSSHVLLWYTLIKLNELNKTFSFTHLDLYDMADRVKQDCIDVFTSTRNGKKMYAYLADLKGNFQFYHDANDLPTVLAPLWKFCNVDDEAWINTMEFAFSEENQGGYYLGHYKGLGSVHTPHPWPLGDGQHMLYCHLTEKRDQLNAIWDKLIRIVQWDGLFSEAIHEETGVVESRHWFSWPGAFISTVLLQIS